LEFLRQQNCYLSDNAADAPSSSSNSAIPSDFFDAPPKAPVIVKSEKRSTQIKEVSRQLKNADSSRGLKGWYWYPFLVFIIE
jgi:hypothetical protein